VEPGSEVKDGCVGRGKYERISVDTADREPVRIAGIREAVAPTDGRARIARQLAAGGQERKGERRRRDRLRDAERERNGQHHDCHTCGESRRAHSSEQLWRRTITVAAVE
jgi:hypothetical protein